MLNDTMNQMNVSNYLIGPILFLFVWCWLEISQCTLRYSPCKKTAYLFDFGQMKRIAVLCPKLHESHVGRLAQLRDYLDARKEPVRRRRQTHVNKLRFKTIRYAWYDGQIEAWHALW